MILPLPISCKTGKAEIIPLKKIHPQRWISAAVLSLISLSISAADLQVPSAAYPTIGEAIEGSKAGDVIHLAPGLYKENITLDKPLTLIGSPNKGSVIDGSGEGTVITVDSRDVTVSGLEVRHSGDVIETPDACIYITMLSADVKIEDNRLEQCSFGIWVNGSPRPQVINNTVSGYMKTLVSDRGNGIHIWNAIGALIKGNRVFGGRDGIYLSNTNESTIQDNVMDSTRFGIHYMYNHMNTISGNVTCNSNVGQAMMYSKKLVISNNAVINNRDHGMMLRAIFDSKIRGNTAYGNDKGIYVNDSDFNEISNNWIENNNVGIAVMAGAENTTVLDNNFISNAIQVLFTWRFSLYWNNEERGNYWSDYLGWDYNEDNIGDKIYYASNQIDGLMHRHPKMRLLALSPVIQLLQALETRFPVLRTASVIDKKPAMHPTTATPTQITAPEKACL